MISKKTKYGLKALAYLAKLNSGEKVQVQQIAEKENISHKFLEAIMLTLKNSGFLGSKKGKNGGYYLIKPADQIVMSDVIRQLEGPIAMIPCVSLNFYEKCDDCPDEAACSVHALMLEWRDSSLHVLKNKTLKDLVSQTV